MSQFYLGINVGSTSIKACLIDSNKKEVWSKSEFHEGNIKETILAILGSYRFPENTLAAVTGTEGRQQLNLPQMIEPIAFEAALAEAGVSYDASVSMGGEAFVVYSLQNNKIVNTFSGNKCASGTGEFFKQQLMRMDCGLDAVQKVAPDSKVVKLSSRCSVFMKSDCTHKLNKGEARKDDIILSLSSVMANKVIDFLTKAKIKKGNILLTGGVTLNPHIVKIMREELPHLEFLIPKEASYYEAYGAAIKAIEIGSALPKKEKIFAETEVFFPRYEAIHKYKHLVNSIPSKRSKIVEGREYIMGVDGGSTTTKITLIDYETEEIAAAYYGRTHGDPIHAVKICLEEIKKQVQDQIGNGKIKISLVATTGSSREILGVYLETMGVYNEIIAHTVGSTFYNPAIDTIFEIGGQDAKYVSIQNNVPIDYAMNEACSAGTGSFLEESSKGDLNIQTAQEIGPVALASNNPLKFGEHCSAFINSDIRKAIQQGASREDITAGLVFSIVSNYLNRVVGNRKIGSSIVLQGGVAKNPAMGLAFATILNKNITIPPDPELLGCFGVGILAKRKFETGLLEKGSFSIDDLLAHNIVSEGEFKCNACANLCPIKIMKIGGHQYYFGGRCSKYTNMRKKIKIDENAVDYIALREKLMFEDFGQDFSKLKNPKASIGVLSAFSIYSLWPFYSTFFYELGVNLHLSKEILPEGFQKMETTFCYPAEIAHGAMQDLVNQNFDYYFIPHFKDMPSFEDDVHATLCPIMQGLPYYLRTAFNLEENKILRPVVSFKDGYESEIEEFYQMGEKLGFSKEEVQKAFRKGISQLEAYFKKTQQIGREILEKQDPDKTYILLLGRPYNAFTKDANLGIPKKFQSKGYTIVPFDFMPMEDEITPNMYWYYGQQVLKAATVAKKNPNFFVCYISNFSCAPDSFILHFIRWIQQSKPFLVLELDSHSADAGVDTRIEAFLDIIEGYKKTLSKITDKRYTKRYEISLEKGKEGVIDRQDNNKIIPFRDKRVKIVWPSMGRLSVDLTTAVANSIGLNSVGLPVADTFSLQLARNVASGKECIPALLVLGSFLKYLATNPQKEDDILVMFMPITTGPCRTGQYYVFYEKVFQELNYQNTVILALNSDNSYSELGASITKEVWWALVVGDYMTDIQNAIQVTSKDPEYGAKVFDKCWQSIIEAFGTNRKKNLIPTLKKVAQELHDIPKSKNIDEIKKVMVVGEIFVRRDDFSLRTLLKMLAEKQIYSKIAGLTEWINYTDFDRKYLLNKAFRKKGISAYFSKLLIEKLKLKAELWYKKSVDHKIKHILKESGLVADAPHDMDKIVKTAHDKFTTYEFCTEATVSSGVAAVAMDEGYFDGIVIMSPFACLPGRLIEGIYAPYAKSQQHPVILIENDGNEYAPGLVSKLEVFILNVLRYDQSQQKKD